MYSDCELFNSLYPVSQISFSTVSKVRSKFTETGSVVTKRKSGQLRSAFTEEMELDVLFPIQ